MYTVVLINGGAFGIRIAPRPGKPGSWTTADPLPDDAGQMLVTVPRVASQADELVPKFRAANQEPRTLVRIVPFMADNLHTSERNWSMRWDDLWSTETEEEYEWPPTPPQSGVNVFGQISRLGFSEARAHLTVGTKPRSLRARTPLELRDIRGEGVVGNRFLVPVRVNRNTAQLLVQGEADARINGEAVATATPLIRRVLGPDWISLVCTVAGALMAVLAFRNARQ